MAMTNREEVAKKLREGGIARNEKEAYVLLLHCIGIRSQLPAVNTYKSALERLADIIDPTCKVENEGEVPLAKELLTTWFCSECDSPIYNDMQPSYCIYCGARAVQDEA